MVDLLSLSPHVCNGDMPSSGGILPLEWLLVTRPTPTRLWIPEKISGDYCTFDDKFSSQLYLLVHSYNANNHMAKQK